MKKIFALLMCVFVSAPCFAKFKDIDKRFQTVSDWDNFEKIMAEAELRDRQIGWSYLLSGLLVGIGSTIGAQSSQDTGSKLIFGISASFGIGAAGYGALKLANGNNYTSFYESIRHSSLSPTQRDELVRNYIAEEKEQEKSIRLTRIITHVVIGGLNLYSAGKEEDKNTRTFFQFLGTVNLAMALAYSF